MTTSRPMRAAVPFALICALTGGSTGARAAVTASETRDGTSQSLLAGVSVGSAKDGWAVGEYDVPDRPSATLTEHWDGSAWTRVPSPNVEGNTSSSLAAVAVIDAGDVWAVGAGYGRAPRVAPLIEHWNGRTWKIVEPEPVPGTHVTRLAAVTALSPTDVWAVGTYDDDVTHYTHALIEHWNGRSWRSMPAPEVDGLHEELTAVAASSPRDVWAVGSHSEDGRQVTLTEHWDGIQWSQVPSPSPTKGAAKGVGLNGVVSLGRRDAWAVGTGIQSYQVTSPVIEHWDGAAWHLMRGVNLPGLHGVELFGVSATSPTDVWAAGDTVFPSRTFVERWNGRSWAQVDSPITFGSTVNDLFGVDARSPRDAWAVGWQSSAAGFQTLFLQWDGDRWSVRR